jgi:hypothetical protein
MIQLWWVLLLAVGISLLVAIGTLLRRCIAHHRTPAPPAFAGGGAPGPGAGVGPSYGRSESELAAVATVERYALHPGGRPQAEEKAGLDDRLLARLQSFDYKKPAPAAGVAAVGGAAAAGDIEAPPAAPAPSGKGAAVEEEDRVCVICTDPLATGRCLAVMCGHIFHKECALPWLRTEATCPECRFEITPEMLGGTSRRGGRK